MNSWRTKIRQNDICQNLIGDYEMRLAEKERSNEILRGKLIQALEDRKDSKNRMDCDWEAKLAEKDRQILVLQEEKNALSKEIQECDYYISSQVNEMRKLASYIDHLTQITEKSRGERQLKMSTITNQIGQNEASACDCKRIRALEMKVNKYKMKLAAKEESNKALLEKLEAEKISKQKLEEAFARTTKIYEDLLNRSQGFEDYESCKAECEQFKAACNDLRAKALKVEQLEEEIKNFNHCMVDQDNKINQLLTDIEDMSCREKEMKITILNMEANIEEYKEKLEKSHNEKCVLKNKVEALETQIEDYESTMALKDENNKVILETLEKEKLAKAKIEANLHTIVKTDEHLKTMLTQASQTIKAITQKLEECDIERLETQRDNQMKITELEGQLVVANATIKKLKENLDKMKGIMDENVDLRTLSAQLHESAHVQVTQLKDANEDLSKRSQKMVEMYNYLKQVLFEKDKTFEDLRNQLVALRQQLDNEQKLREDTENVLADIAAAGDSELCKLRNVITVLKKEITCLRSQLDELMRNTTAGKLKTRVKQLEVQNNALRKEVARCCSCLKEVLPCYVDPVVLAQLRMELNDLTDETDRLRREIETQKQMRINTVTALQQKLERQAEENKKIKERLEQKNKRQLSLPTVVFVEKKQKDDGSFEYRYLYSVTDGKKNQLPLTQVPSVTSAQEQIHKKNQLPITQAPSPVVAQEQIQMPVAQAPRPTSGQKQIQLPAVQAPSPTSGSFKHQCYVKEDGVEKEVFLDPQFSSYVKEKGEVRKLSMDPTTGLPKQQFYVKEDGQEKNITWDPETGPFKLNTAPTVIKKTVTIPTSADSKEINNLRRDLAESQQKIVELEDKLVGDAHEINELGAKLTMAHEQIAELVRQFPPFPSSKDSSPLQERDDLTKEIENQKREIADLLQKIKDSSGDQAMVQELENKKKENEKLKTMISDLEKQLQHASRLQIELPQGSIEITTVVEHLKESLEMEQKRVNELEEFWRTCENEGEKLKIRIEELIREKSELTNRLTALKKEKILPSASTMYINQLHHVDSDLKNWQDQMTNAVSQVQKQINDITSKVDGNVNDEVVQKLLHEIENLKQALLDNVVSKKKVQLSSELQEKHIDELEKQIHEMQETINKLEETNERLNNAMKEDPEKGSFPREIQERTKELEAQLRDKDRKITNLKSELDRMRNDRLSVISGILVTPEMTEARKSGELLEKLKKAEEEIDSLKGRLMVSKSKESLTDDKDRRLRELEDTLYQWQRDYDNEVGKLKKEIEQVTIRGALPEGCEAHEGLIKELKLNLENLTKQNETLETKNIQLEGDNENLLKMLDHYNEEFEGSIDSTMEEKKVRDLVEHLRELQKKNESLKTRTIQLEIDNGRLRNDLERIMGQENRSFEKDMQRLRDLERQSSRNQEKYQNLKKRLIKLEIENKNLKKEYIDTLIAKEKLALKSHEQEKRLRETNKLLRKTQDKKHTLTLRMIQMQVDNDNLKKQLEIALGDDINLNFQKTKRANEDLVIKNAQLEAQNEYLVSLLPEEEVKKLTKMEMPDVDIREWFEKQEDQENWKSKALQLEMENQLMKKELEGVTKPPIREIDITTFDEAEKPSDDLTKLDSQNLEIRAVELQIENEYLKSELNAKEKYAIQDVMTEKKIAELEDQIHKLTEANEKLKLKTVDMELDSDYMRKELDRITTLKQTFQDAPDQDLEKKMHDLKIKNDHLEIETRNLKIQLETMGKEQISLQSHVQEKRLQELETRLQEVETMKKIAPKLPRRSIAPVKQATDEVEEVEEKMEAWREQFMPQLKDLKKDLDKLIGKSRDAAEARSLEEAKAKIAALEIQNRNMRVEIDLLRKGTPINETKLAKEIEQVLKDPKVVDAQRVKELEAKLKECQETNELLKNEQMSLDKHVQEKKIRELEAQIREYQFYDPSKMDLQNKPRRERKSIVIDVQDMKVKELGEQLDMCRDNLKSLQAELDNQRKATLFAHADSKMRIQDFQGQNEELKEELERFRKINELQQKLITDLEKKLKECRTTNDSLKTEVKTTPSSRRVSFQEMSQSEQNVQAGSEELRKEVERLRKENEQQRRMIHELEENLKKCRDINKDLRRENDELQLERQFMRQEYGVPSENTAKDKRERQRQMKQGGPVDDEVRPSEVPEELALLESENEMLKQKLEDLRDENLSLRIKRAKELEGRLRESKISYKEAKKSVEEDDASKLEKQLKEIRTKNELVKAEFESLRKELAVKISEQEASEDREEISRLKKDNKTLTIENKQLKNEINELQKKIQQMGGGEYGEIITKLETKIEENDKLTREILELEKQNDEQKEQILELQKKLEEEEFTVIVTELKNIKQENEKLKKDTLDLQTKIQSLGNVEYNEMDLENQKLKLIISDLERRMEELTNLQLEVGKGDMDEKRSRKLEETLQKYHDNNESLKIKIIQLEEEKTGLKTELNARIEKEKRMPGSETQARQIRKLEETLKKYQDNNENMKKKVARLEATYQEKRIEELEAQVETCQKNNEGLKMVTHQLESEIRYLKHQLAAFAKKRPPRQKDETQPMMVGYQPPIYSMPVFLQAPFVTYGNYVTPQAGDSEEEFQQLSHLVEKIQHTLRQRRQEKGKERSIVIDLNEKNTSEEEEEEQRTLDFDSYDQAPTLLNTSSSLTVEEMNRQLLLQQQTKERMDKLQEALHKAMTELELDSPSKMVAKTSSQVPSTSQHSSHHVGRRSDVDASKRKGN